MMICSCRIYSWDKNSRISLRSFSSWIRVKSFVPSRLIVSGRSKGSLSYILPPLKWQPWHFDLNNGSTWVAKSTRDEVVETATTSWALTLGVSEVTEIVRLHEYELTDTNNTSISSSVRMAACYSDNEGFDNSGNGLGTSALGSSLCYQRPKTQNQRPKTRSHPQNSSASSQTTSSQRQIPPRQSA